MARRPKSAFEGAIDLLALCRLVLLRKSNNTLDLLTEARLERRFRSATRDLPRLYAGYYVAESLNEMTDQGDPYPELFRTANEVLRGLDDGENLQQLVLWFEMCALGILGHMPSLHDCASCGARLADAPRIPFGLLSGGVLCPRCRSGTRSVVSVSLGALRVLRQYAEAWQTGATFTTAPIEPPPKEVRGELRGLLTHYLANLWGKRPRMHRYLTVLAN